MLTTEQRTYVEAQIKLAQELLELCHEQSNRALLEDRLERLQRIAGEGA